MFSSLLWLVASLCLVSCSGEVEDSPVEAEDDAEASPAAMDPFGGEVEDLAETDEDSVTVLARSEESDSSLPGALLSTEGLSPEHQETLNEAIQKAMSKVDLETLVSAIASNQGVEGLDTSKLASGVVIRSGAELDPGAMKRLGIDPEVLEGLGAGGAQVQGVSVIVLGDPAGIRSDLLSPGRGALKSGGANQETTIETDAVTVEAGDDPERGARFQQRLESGDSDALAEEIADLIQQGIDTATLQQVLGGVPQPTAEP